MDMIYHHLPLKMCNRKQLLKIMFEGCCWGGGTIPVTPLTDLPKLSSGWMVSWQHETRSVFLHQIVLSESIYQVFLFILANVNKHWYP